MPRGETSSKEMPPTLFACIVALYNIRSLAWLLDDLSDQYPPTNDRLPSLEFPPSDRSQTWPRPCLCADECSKGVIDQANTLNIAH